MNPKDLKDRLATATLDIKRAINHDLPKIIGNKVVSMVKQNFQTESYFGEAWQEVQRRMPRPRKTQKGYQYTRPKGADGSRKILTGRSGDLRRSIQYKTDRAKVIIFSDLPYSAAHNEGTTTAGRGNHTVIPRRQFLGEHPTLQQAANTIAERIITQHLNKLAE